MYKLLIVDDEEDIRRGIARSIPWNQWGFEVMGEAENGEEAVAQIEKQNPDLVLTDIRMQKMDGIQLMQYIHNNHPNIKVIILSGYNDVEYLNMAIKNQVMEYLLKPTDIDEFQELFLKVKNKLDEEKRQREELSLLKATAKENKNLSYSRVLNNLLDGYIGDNKELEWKKDMEKSGIRFDHCLLLVIETGFSRQKDENDHYILKQSIINYCNSRKTSWKNQYFLSRDKKVVGVVTPTCEERDLCTQINQYILEIQEEIGNIFSLSPAVGVSPLNTKESHLPDCYQKAVHTAVLIPDIGEDKKKSSLLVNGIKEYLDQQYCSNSLSLESVAEHFRKNPAYISKVFKKEAGFNFSDYITQKRMSKSKELLNDLSLKIYEIAEMTGYADASNFIKVFKKNCGMSPNEYRTVFSKGY